MRDIVAIGLCPLITSGGLELKSCSKFIINNRRHTTGG